MIQSGFLDPPATADLNGRNLSALYEIVDGRERNPQVHGRLFYGKQIVNRSFAHSFRRRSTLNHFDHFINYENWHTARTLFWSEVRLASWMPGRGEPLGEAECLEGQQAR